MSADSFCQAVEKKRWRSCPQVSQTLTVPVSLQPETSGKLMWRRWRLEMSLWNGGNRRGSSRRGSNGEGLKGGKDTVWHPPKDGSGFSWSTDSAASIPARSPPAWTKEASLGWISWLHIFTIRTETFVSLQQKHLLSRLTKEDKLWAFAGKDWIKKKKTSGTIQMRLEDNSLLCLWDKVWCNRNFMADSSFSCDCCKC